MPAQDDLNYVRNVESKLAKPDPTFMQKFNELSAKAEALRARLPGLYLYIFEDGEIALAATKPTVADFLAVEEGLLQIIRIKAGEVVFLESDGPVPIPEAIVKSDDFVGLFHDRIRVRESSKSEGCPSDSED